MIMIRVENDDNETVLTIIMRNDNKKRHPDIRTIAIGASNCC
jgi:hypothetical protein